MRKQKIYSKKDKTSVLAAKAVLGGGDVRSQLETLRDKNLTLQKELADIIKSFGFPENYLEPWYKCPDCKDRGDIDGKMCSCMKKLLRQISYDRLNRISPLELCDFDSFSLEYYPKTPKDSSGRSPYDIMKRVLAVCRGYARDFTPMSKSLLFQGAPGLGKTHLSLAIAREVIDKGYGVVYVSAPALINKLAKESFDYGSKSDDIPTVQTLSECDLLIIDDLGTEFGTRFSVSSVYNIINTRVIMSKPTIISTNLTFKELEETYNSRIISRMIGTLHRVVFTGSDVRQLKRRMPVPKPDSE